MDSFSRDAAAFLERRRAGGEAARHTAVLRLACGIDLHEALAQSGQARERTLRRLGRIIERERLRGVRGQASYDLDRHIALKKALERLRYSPA